MGTYLRIHPRRLVCQTVQPVGMAFGLAIRFPGTLDKWCIGYVHVHVKHSIYLSHVSHAERRIIGAQALTPLRQVGWDLCRIRSRVGPPVLLELPRSPAFYPSRAFRSSRSSPFVAIRSSVDAGGRHRVTTFYAHRLTAFMRSARLRWTQGIIRGQREWSESAAGWSS